MATNKLKTFLFRHVEKVLLGLALAGLVYVIAYNLTRASVGDIVLDLNDKASTVITRIKNPPEPPVPGPPPPPPLVGDLRPPEAALAAANPFVLRTVGEAVPATEVAVVPVGVAPPAGVLLTAVPGANVIEWWRATGQGSDVRVDIFKIEKDRFPGPVPEIIERSIVGNQALGFTQVALNLEAADDGHGRYEDTYIVGEVHYLYAVASVRVTVQETGSAGSPEAYWDEFDELMEEGISYEETLMILGPPPGGSGGESTEKITAQEWGKLFRTAQVVTAIPLVFELRTVTVDRETGEPVGRVYVKRLHLGRWYGTFFTVSKGDAIGEPREFAIRVPGEKSSRQDVDLDTGATVLGFEQFEEERVIDIRDRQIKRTVKSWKMQYRDKDGNALEMVKKSGR